MKDFIWNPDICVNIKISWRVLSSSIVVAFVAFDIEAFIAVLQTPEIFTRTVKPAVIDTGSLPCCPLCPTVSRITHAMAGSHATIWRWNYEVLGMLAKVHAHVYF